MANQYQIPREVKEAQEFWQIVREEYDQGLNNYFDESKSVEHYGCGLETSEELNSNLERGLHNFIFGKKAISRRLNLGGE